LFTSFAGLAQTKKNFTPAELAKYNGKNGSKAYVAVNGQVYDVTNVPQWAQGKHFCPDAYAGKDITALFQHSPHLKRSDYLSRFPVVGQLVATTKPAVSPNESNPPVPTAQPQPQPTPSPAPLPNRHGLFRNPIVGGLITLFLILAIWLIYRSRIK
jgi:predicted heme/steroid binding protein